jgi:hypothetical protein
MINILMLCGPRNLIYLTHLYKMDFRSMPNFFGEEE